MSQVGDQATRRFGVVYREHSPQAESLAQSLLLMLQSAGHSAWQAGRNEETTIRERLAQTDVAIVLGGDGTILSVARLCAPEDIPILGINFGRVGFLTELEPSEVEARLPYYLNGEYWLDERAMVQAELSYAGKYERHIALNDVVLVRGAEPRVISIVVSIDGHEYNTTVADGVIISTATGSTAYNLAAGGPILHPQVRSCVLTPIAPHLAADRSLILEPSAVVTLHVHEDSAPAVLSADGQISRQIPPGSDITVRTNSHVTKFLRRRSPTYFYRILSAKLRDNL